MLQCKTNLLPPTGARNSYNLLSRATNILDNPNVQPQQTSQFSCLDLL